MKKLCLLLAAVLPLLLAACGAPAPAQTTAPAPETENQVALVVDKTSYDREERIEVSLDLEALDQATAVIVVADSALEHGREGVVHDNYAEYRYLADFSELPFYLWAPAEDGLYDVRVYANGEDGVELASITIAVGAAELPPPAQS